MPKVSVIIPVYKAEKYINRCIDSVLAQTFTDWECILVDDGSPDRSGEICDEYAKKDSRIRAFHKQNEGVSAARNMGIEESKGEWIMFLDSDDYLDETCLDICMSEIEKDNLDTLQFGFQLVSNDGKLIEQKGTDIACTDRDKYINTRKFLFNVCGTITKSEIVKENSLRFNPHIRLAEDQLFIMSILANSTRIEQIHNALYNYRQTETSSIHHINEKDQLNSLREICNFSYTSLFHEYIDVLLVQFTIDYLALPGSDIPSVYNILKEHPFRRWSGYGIKYALTSFLLLNAKLPTLIILGAYGKLKNK